MEMSAEKMLEIAEKCAPVAKELARHPWCCVPHALIAAMQAGWQLCEIERKTTMDVAELERIASLPPVERPVEGDAR